MEEEYENIQRMVEELDDEQLRALAGYIEDLLTCREEERKELG